MTPTAAQPTQTSTIWYIMAGRTGLFFLFQCVWFLLYLTGKEILPAEAWLQGAAWWPFSVFFTNLICAAVMSIVLKKEGISYKSLFSFNTLTWKKDTLLVFAALLLMVPISMGPNLLLGIGLFGNMETPLSLFLLPLPVWAVLLGAMLLFPITQGVVELAFYFRFCMPRLTVTSGSSLPGYFWASIFLSIQHTMIPFLFNGYFIAWRGLMFLPFAFFMGALLLWRPRLLPYLAVVHTIMDINAGILYFTGI